MQPAASWLPLELLRRAARETLSAFRDGAGKGPCLVVRLDDFSDNLGKGLAIADEDAGRPHAARAMQSTLQLSAALSARLGLRSERPPPPASTGSEATAPRRTFPMPEWLAVRCYVVRLATRGSGKGPLRIGRDLSHEVVLQHTSVSATHAQLTLAPELTVTDEKSRNGTLVNGTAVQGTVRLKIGDRIKFGAVQTVLCSADDIWYARR